jgi:hypothetical protein
MSDLDALKTFMNQPDTAAAPALPLAAPASPTPDLDQLNQFMKPELDQDKFGSLPQQILAGIEGAARGVSLGTSDLAEIKAGLATPEEVRGRMEINPWISRSTEFGGGASLIAATGGLGALPEAGAALGTRLAAGAALGGAFGGGSAVTDYALGDPNLNAQKIATKVGVGALLGLGAEGLGAGIKSFLGRGGAPKGSISEAINEAGGNPVPISEPASADGAVVDIPKDQTKGLSISEIGQKVANAKANGEVTELPQKALVTDAESRLGDLDHPLHGLQIESLDNQDTRDIYRNGLELPTKLGSDLRDFETIQRNERSGALEQTIQDLSPNTPNTSNLVDGGERAIKTFTDNYQAQQKALLPALRAIKSYETEDPFNHVPGVIQAFAEKVPGIARMFDTTGDELKINPYSTSWGIEKATYNAAKQAVDALKEPAFIDNLMNIRNGLDQNINLMQGGKAAGQISNLKSGMLDYIQKEIEKVDPYIAQDQSGVHIRSVLKDYAINEQQREVIEKAFGASVGSPEWGQISKIKNEDILPKIFKNTATVNAARQILEPEQFGEMLSNYLSAAKKEAATEGIQSPRKFYSFLDNNKYALDAALFDQPGIHQRIRDLNTTMRMISEGPLNTSRTAKSLLGVLTPNQVSELNPAVMFGKLQEYVGEKIGDAALSKKINQALGEKAAQQQKFDAINKISKGIDQKITDGINGILNTRPKKK